MRGLIRADWFGLLIAVAITGVGLSQLAPAFATEYNQYVLLRNVAVTIVVAFSQMMVLAVGHLNVAVGAMGGLCAVLMAGLMESYGVPVPLALGAGLLAGAAMGFANGFLTVKTGINSFVITLATGSAFAGINLGITSAQPYYHMAPDLVAWGQARTGPFPHLLLVPLLIGAVLAILLYGTVLGRQILAVGGNARAAEVTGIPVDRVIITVHVISGLLVAVAAILLMARLGSGQPTIGADWLLPSFAGPIIGGAALEGGAVSVVGTILASILIAFIEIGLVLAPADPFWVQFLLGVLILAAVGIGRLRRDPDRARTSRRPGTAPQRMD